MAHKEINIDYSYKLYAKYFHGIGTSNALNLFIKKDRDQVTDLDELTKKRLEALVSVGIFAEDSTGSETWIPLTSLLVIPDKIPSDGCPVVFLFHGMHGSFFKYGTSDRKPEIMSHKGHSYLQYELAKSGIMSLSMNLNMVNAFEHDDDFTLRVQVFLLHYLLLQLLNGTPDATLTQTASPLLILDNASAPTVLSKDLSPVEGVSSKSPMGLYQNLQKELKGKINFSLTGTFGHSRGANAAANVVSFFAASGSATKLEQVMKELVKLAGNPPAKTVKAIVAVEPPEHTTSINQDELFFLAIGSTHDEDVQNDAINLYESPVCPKGMVFIHGATHLRFNTVWRKETSSKETINRNIRCQSPIRILSNDSHDGFIISFAGGVFLATLAGQEKKLLLFTHEVRAPEKLDVERAWKFPFPFKHNPGVLELDARVTQFVDTTTGNVTALTKSKLNENWVSPSLPSVFVQKVDIFKVEKKQGQEVEIKIAISSSDKIDSFTHFSFRYAKFFNIFDPKKRDSEPLKNYELKLFSGTNQIGRTIPGNKVTSLIQRVYPTRKYGETDTGYGCSDSPTTILQTAEVKFTEFFQTGPHTISDLARVDAIALVLNAASGKTGPDVFCLVDFICTFRDIK